LKISLIILNNYLILYFYILFEMSDIIESDPEILGGKPVIKGTRIPVALIYELISLNYSIDDIIKEYPHLDRKIIIKVLELGKDALNNLSKVNLDKILNKEAY